MVDSENSLTFKNGWSPLMEACALGHFGVARILLQHHARVDVFDENGRTALHLAAANGHLKLTHLLLTSKAFVNRCNYILNRCFLFQIIAKFYELLSIGLFLIVIFVGIVRKYQ